MDKTTWDYLVHDDWARDFCTRRYVATGFASDLWTYPTSMLLITLGEIILFPKNSEYLNRRAPANMRASYFGASQVAQLGFFIRPWVGGVALPYIGGKTLFTFVGIIVVAGIPFYPWSNALRMYHQPTVLDDVPCE